MSRPCALRKRGLSVQHIDVEDGGRLGYGRTITFPRLCPLSTSR